MALSVTNVEALARPQLVARKVAELADRDPQLIVTGDEDVARLLERPGFARFGRAVVIDEHSRPVGLISITHVQRALRAPRLVEHTSSAAA